MEAQREMGYGSKQTWEAHAYANQCETHEIRTQREQRKIKCKNVG